METKICKQCTRELELSSFRKHANKYVSNKLMSMCKDCYTFNLETTRRKEAEWKIEYERKKKYEEEQRIQQIRMKEDNHIYQMNGSNRWVPRPSIVERTRHDYSFEYIHEKKYRYKFYHVYTLTCPMIHKVRYVGITSQDLSCRLKEHMKEYPVEQKREWILSLKNKDLAPIITSIDTADSEREAKHKEQEWIDHYLHLGEPLVCGEAMDVQRVLDVQSGRKPMPVPYTCYLSSTLFKLKIELVVQEEIRWFKSRPHESCFV